MQPHLNTLAEGATQGLERVFLQACALPSFPSLSPAPEGPGGLPEPMSPFWFLL